MTTRNCNVWVGVRDDLLAELKARANWDEDQEGGPYQGPITNRAWKIFTSLDEIGQLGRMFKRVTQGAYDWILFSIYLGKDQATTEMEYLGDTYPGQVDFAGCWWTDNGLQSGTHHDESDPPAIVGTPMVPINHVKLLKFMPDQRDPGTGEVIGPATELSDVHLLAGQAPRNFD